MSKKIHIKKGAEIDGMREACRIAHQALEAIIAIVKPGMSTAAIDRQAGEIIQDLGGKSAFLHHEGFPSQICISVNEEVLHGVGSPAILEVGDIVSLDVGVRYNGWIGDNCKTIPVGGCSPAALKLIDVTRASLLAGIAAAKPGGKISDIGAAVQKVVEYHGFSVVRDFVGHGVGRELHELPQIANYVTELQPWEKDYTISPGMTLAIEPMVVAGPDPRVRKAGLFTIASATGHWAAHEEETILITKESSEILTIS